MVLDASMEGWEEVPRDPGRERRRKRKRGKENKTPVPLHEPAKQILNHTKNATLRKAAQGASLVAQWLRVCLLMQGMRVRALVWEDPTCRGATRPMCHNY